MKYEAPKAKIVDFKEEYVMAWNTYTESGWYDDGDYSLGGLINKHRNGGN